MHWIIALVTISLLARTVLLGDADDIEDVIETRQLVRYINSSPKEYAKIAKLVENAANINGMFRTLQTEQREEFRNENVPAVMADNVTEIPMTTIPSTKPTTKKPKPKKFPISELCANHSEALKQGLARQDVWAVRMIDAAGKPPANILGGGIVWFGDFDECVAIQDVATNVSGIKYRFDAQYCKARVPLRGPLNNIIPGNPTVTLGVCVPDSCSKKDVQNLLRKFLYENVSTELTASIQTCVETDIPYDTRAEIVLVVIGLFIAAMLLGTGYDLIVIQWPKWRHIEEITSSEEIAIEASEKQQLIENTKSRIKEYQPGIPGKLLLSFSMYTNGSKILDTKQGKGVITCINGIRFLSMTWVIIGHAFSAPNNIADNIAEFMPRMLKRWTFMAVCNAYVSVDSFFTLSGLLLTYLVMKELDKNKGRLKWFMFYFHRFWRLTPPYMLVIMVSVSLFHYTGTGPNWPTGGIDKGCEKGWWYNLLYINNFVEDNKKKCFGVAWYLANDMQFYILSPLILLPLYHFHLLGVGILMVFLVGTTITTGVISTHYDIPANNFDAGNSKDWFPKIYIKPYCRMGPYLVGMYAGYLLYKTNCRLQINRYLNLAIWSAAIGTGMAIVYGLYDDINSETPLPTSVAAFYNAVHRTAWGLCISWVIFACATGNGGFINTILSWKAFIPLSRLTYMAYLVHMMILNHWKYSQTKTIHLSDSEYIYEIVGHIVLSFMAAFVTSLAFESPMLGLESVIFRRKQNKR
ncbi:nose resistant to fluoxetine protein 6-like isoform X1 [Mytilus galloprovincialis]|uniref:nose resistant to fluoxetine protein 6-like isoform X1 n=2 Tax=Mytilus galloprovincialis TaxID=29158 RepID=UPI003F7BA8A2